MFGLSRAVVAIAIIGLCPGWLYSGGAGLSEEGRVPLEDLLPGSSALYFSLDVGRMVADFDTLDLVRLYHDDELREFIRPAIEFLKRDSLRQVAAVQFMLNAYGLPGVIRGKLTLALTGLGAVDEQGRIAWLDGDAAFPKELAEQLAERTESVIPDFLLRVETAGRESFESSLERVFELAPTEFATTDLQRDGFSYRSTTFEIPGTPLGALSLYYGFVGEDFLAAFREERLLEVTASLRGGTRPQAALSDDLAFRSWRQSSVRGTEILEIYAGVGHAVPAFMPFLEDSLEDFRTTGLDAVCGAGFALALEQGRMRESFAAVLPDQRRGLLTLLEALEPSGVLTAQVPAGATAALALDLDPAKLFDRAIEFLQQAVPREHELLVQHLSEFQADLGLDLRKELVASLGTQAVIHASLPKSGFIPEVSGSIEVRDQERARAALSRLRQALERAAGDELSIKETTIGEHEGALYVTLKGAPVTPTILLAGNRLHLASSPNVLRQTLRSASEPARPSATSKDLVRCLASSVGEQQADVALLVYFDLASGAEYGLGLSELFMPAILAQAPFQLDAGLMPLPETVAEYLSGVLLTVRISERTLAVDFSSPMVGLALPLAVVSTFLLGLW